MDNCGTNEKISGHAQKISEWVDRNDLLQKGTFHPIGIHHGREIHQEGDALTGHNQDIVEYYLN